MSQSKRAQQPEPPKRRFPYVCKGMVVLWHSEGVPDYPGCPAIVEEVGQMGLDLAVIEPDIDRVRRMTGVRWNHDRDTSEAVRQDSGGWDFTEADLRLRAEFDELGQWPEDLQSREDERVRGKVAEATARIKEIEAEAERKRKEEEGKAAAARLATGQTTTR